jgi:hypothetical protein
MDPFSCFGSVEGLEPYQGQPVISRGLLPIQYFPHSSSPPKFNLIHCRDSRSLPKFKFISKFKFTGTCEIQVLSRDSSSLVKLKFTSEIQVHSRNSSSLVHSRNSSSLLKFKFTPEIQVHSRNFKFTSFRNSSSLLKLKFTSEIQVHFRHSSQIRFLPHVTTHGNCFSTFTLWPVIHVRCSRLAEELCLKFRICKKLRS